MEQMRNKYVTNMKQICNKYVTNICNKYVINVFQICKLVEKRQMCYA